METNPLFSLIPEPKRSLFQIPSSPSLRYQHPKAILLDENENPYNLFGNRYYQNRFAEPGQLLLKARVQSLWNEDAFLITQGEWEGLDWWLKVFAVPGETRVLFPEMAPSYLQILFQVYQCHGFSYPIPLEKGYDFADLEQRIANVQPHLVMLGNPDDPTGYLLDPEFVLHVLKKYGCFLFVDESFIEFASHSTSLLHRIRESRYLMVKRSFAYAYALAGLNLHLLFAHPDLLALLTHVISDHHLSRIAAQFLYEAIEDMDRVYATIPYIQEQREWLRQAFLSLPIVRHVTPSQGNYLFVQFHDLELVYRHLLENRILTKRYPKGLRITIGNESENQILLNMMKRLSVAQSGNRSHPAI